MVLLENMPLLCHTACPHNMPRSMLPMLAAIYNMSSASHAARPVHTKQHYSVKCTVRTSQRGLTSAHGVLKHIPVGLSMCR
jgi:hypothetical protein